jgi:hypothetical protein
VGYVFYQAAVSPDTWIYEGANPGIGKMLAFAADLVQSPGAAIPVITMGFGAFLLFRPLDGSKTAIEMASERSSVWEFWHKPRAASRPH